MPIDQEITSALRQQMNEMLQRHNFRHELTFPDLDRWSGFGWERFTPWRKEVLRITWPKTSPDYLLGNIEVFLRDPTEDIAIDGTTIDFASGRRRGSYKLPSKLKLHFGGISRFFRSVVTDAEVSLEWFQHFNNPKAARERLEGGEANFAAKGTDRFAMVVTRLRQLEMATQ